MKVWLPIRYIKCFIIVGLNKIQRPLDRRDLFTDHDLNILQITTDIHKIAWRHYLYTFSLLHKHQTTEH